MKLAIFSLLIIFTANAFAWCTQPFISNDLTANQRDQEAYYSCINTEQAQRDQQAMQEKMLKLQQEQLDLARKQQRGY